MKHFRVLFSLLFLRLVMKDLILVLLITFIASCASSSKDMSEWSKQYLSKHISVYIKVQGPPTDVYSIPGGGKIYSWGIAKVTNASAYVDPNTGMAFGSSSSGYTCIIRFTVDDKENVTGFKYEGSCKV